MPNTVQSPVRRRRPVLRVVGLAALGTALVYAGAAIFLSTRPVVISLDAVQQFRQSLPTPATPEDAAWPAYRDALIAMGRETAVGFKDQAVTNALGAWPGSNDWPVLAAWVDANQPAFAAARLASRRPMLGFPVGQGFTGKDAAFFAGVAVPEELGTEPSNREHFPMLAVGMPQLGCMRALAMALQADLFRAAEQGDGERATQDLEAIVAVSNHVPEGRILIADLVGLAIRHVATMSTTAVLEWKGGIFTDDQLRRLQAALRSVPAALDRLDLSAERLAFQDVVQRTFSDDGQGDGWFVPTSGQLRMGRWIEQTSPQARAARPSPWTFLAFHGATRPLVVFAVAGRRESLEHYDAFTRGVEQASTVPLRQAVAWEDGPGSSGQPGVPAVDSPNRYFLESLMGPALSKAAVNVAMGRALREAACVAIAAEQFRRANGAWPKSAEQLAPFLGGTVPMDPLADGPIRMATDPDGFRMWSIGRDGKDDGGNLHPTPRPGVSAPSVNTPEAPAADGTTVDWVWFAPRGSLERWGN